MSKLSYSRCLGFWGPFCREAEQGGGTVSWKCLQSFHCFKGSFSENFDLNIMADSKAKSEVKGEGTPRGGRGSGGMNRGGGNFGRGGGGGTPRGEGTLVVVEEEWEAEVSNH